MTAALYYNMEGEPITQGEWVTLLEGGPSRQISYDETGDVRVSTVWLGLNHNLGDGPQLIFETMIFGGEHDQYQERYTTREQAEDGHRRACALALASD